MLDLHCHVLPNLDDGPVDKSESLDLCRALVDDGITAVIATPHQLGRFDGLYDAGDIRKAVKEFRSQLASAGIELDVYPGAEIRVDERIIHLLSTDKVLTLVDNDRFVLLELLPDVMVNISGFLQELSGRGVVPIIAHPERHEYLGRNLKIIKKWLSLGARLQVTAASLVGDSGPFAEKFAWHLLERNWVSYIATDAHGLDVRRPAMTPAYNAISKRFGKYKADELCILNPKEVLK